jgi:hypothetical protein
MGSSAARKVLAAALPFAADAEAETLIGGDTDRETTVGEPLAGSADTALDDGLPPPTKAQVFFWAEVCGAIHERGREGMTNEKWPPDLDPDVQDLKQMADRRLLAKRRGVWRLRRDWYERLTTLKVMAVPTPVLRRVERPAPDCPTYAELEAYERICRWLDACPRGRSRLPFAGLVALGAEDNEPVPELRAMRRLRLVRHTAGCEWALSASWQKRLQELHRGIARALRNVGPEDQSVAAPAPVSLCAGLDTWGLNWVVETKALPPRLRAELDDAQAEAQAAEREVETRWAFDGVPLRIYQAGVRAKGVGDKATGARSKGVSWSYILVNPSLRLLIRRTPLGGIAASARLGSECLWRRTPLAALNDLNALIRRMWGREKGRWQVSYAHLAHDVADAPLELEQLERYVSRSRRRALYDAAQAESERLRRGLRVIRRGISDDAEFEWDSLDWDALPTVDWEAEFANDEELLAADPFAEDGYEREGVNGWHGTARREIVAREATVALEEPLERRALTVHRWGQRLSGVAFSQGGPVSFVMYRKDWEGRLKGKRHMEPLWKAAGWDGQAAVTRHEARLAREPIRELRAVIGGGTGVEQTASPLDDPWVFLARQADVWGEIVGRAEACPGAVDVAWIRRVIPREGESNRSRWDTDPAWHVVQRAPFASCASTADRRLIRRRQRLHDVRKLDQQVLGLLKTREALLHADPMGRDLSLAVRDALRALEREVTRRGEEFGAAAWVRRRDRHLPVQTRGTILPFRRRIPPGERDAERAPVRDLETALDGMAGWRGDGGPEVGIAATSSWMPAPACGVLGASAEEGARDGRVSMRTRAWLRQRSAEIRMREAFAALEEAEARGGSPRVLDRLAAVFERAMAAYAASAGMLRQLGGMDGSER